MSDNLHDVLKAHLAVCKAEWVLIGKEVPWVRHRRFIPIHHKSMTHVWINILRRAGLRHVEFHATRHSYARMLLAARVPVTYVQSQLGHASIRTTVDTYGQWMPNGERYVNEIDQKISMVQEGVSG